MKYGLIAGNGSFPNVSGSGMNFWADVVFSPLSPTIKPSSLPRRTGQAGRPAPTVSGDALADHLGQLPQVVHEGAVLPREQRLRNGIRGQVGEFRKRHCQ